jgi:hypothetical protein
VASDVVAALPWCSMHRSELTVDLGAVRRNAARCCGARRRQLWAVVKADAYGHGAVDVAAASSTRARARSASRPSPRGWSCGRSSARAHPRDGPDRVEPRDRRGARGRLELALWDEELPEGVRVHLKLDTGMGRWGLSELPSPRRRSSA